MAKLYKKIPNTQASRALNTTNLRLAPEMVPNAEGGVLDIVRTFPWTLMPPGSKALQEAPYIRIKEFYLLDSYINQLLKSYNIEPVGSVLNAGDLFGTLTDLAFVATNIEGSSQLYEGLYDHVYPSGFEYYLPYFDNPMINLNTWAAKSTYEQIIQRQKLFAPFTNPGEIVDLIDQALPNIPGKGLFMGFLKRQASNFELVPQGVFDLYAGNPNASIFASTGYYGSKLLTLGVNVGKIVDIYETISRAVVDYNRIEELLKVAVSSPIASIDSDPVLDKPHIWTSTAPRSITISFPLFNINADSSEVAEQHIARNWELCYLLTYQNLYNKRNLFTGIPPVFYEIEVPGLYYTKAGYVSNISILNAGNIRNLGLPVGETTPRIPVNVPDAYVVNITLTDFFMPSRNFLNTVCDYGARNRIKASFAGGIKQKDAPEVPQINYNEGIGLPPEAFQGGFGGGGIK